MSTYFAILAMFGLICTNLVSCIYLSSLQVVGPIWTTCQVVVGWAQFILNGIISTSILGFGGPKNFHGLDQICIESISIKGNYLVLAL